MPINRRDIPPLVSQCSPEFTHVVIARSYSFGRSEPIRMCRGDSLTVWVKIHPHFAKNCRVRFFNTLESGTEDEPHYEESHAREDGMFLCFFVPVRPEAFVFRASYSLDDGQTWVLDDVPYTWVIVDPQGFNDIRMYTLIPTVSKHIGNWKRELDEIKELGCNAVHILPVTFMDESESPYSAHDLFAIDPSYLDPDDSRDGLAQWEEFVEHAKTIGIRLCVDLVLNHVGVKSKIAQVKPEWIHKDPARPDGFKRAGCWAGSEWMTWEDLLLLNYSNKDDNERDALWTYMLEYATFWANYAAYTGGMVRFDNLHSSNNQFVATLNRTLRRKFPDLILLAEFFTDENTLVRRTNEWDLDLLLATPWEYKFVPELRSYLKYLHRLSDQVRFLVPVSSHDSGSPTQEFNSVESTFPRYAVSALLSFGATGLTQGVEWGVEKKVHFIGRNLQLERKKRESLATFIARVNEIQKANRAFRMNQNCVFVDENHIAIIAAVRRVPIRPHECFLVAANFDTTSNHKLTVNIAPFIVGYGEISVEEVLTHGGPVTVANPNVEVSLNPCEVKVLRCRYEHWH